MAPLAQQEPTETMDVAAIERAVATMRLMNGIEVKIASETPLNREEIDHLYQFDAPIYERTRDDGPVNGFYEDEEPELAARLNRYYTAQQSARQSSIEVLRGEYGDDADWLLASSKELEPRVSELLAAGASPALLAYHVSADTRLAQFDEFNTHGANLDATAVYEAYRENRSYGRSSQGQFDAFVLKHKSELAMDAESTLHLAHVLLAEAGEEGFEKAIEEALRFGAEHRDILYRIGSEDIESRFGWLRDAGFDAGSLLSRCRNDFILDNFDELFRDTPDAMSISRLNKPSLQEKSRYIVALHRNGRPVQEHLGGFSKGQHYTLTPQYEEMVAAGISIHDIVDSFSGDDESLIHYYADWLMANGANADAIKAKFSLRGIVSVHKALQKAGIDVDLQGCADQLPTTELFSRSASFWTEAGVQIDYDARLDNYDEKLTTELTFAFLHAGVSPEKVFTKVETGALINDAMIDTFVEAGVPHDKVWKKADKWMHQGRHWLAFTSGESSDADFEAALRALPLDMVKDSMNTVARRPSFMNLFVDRLVEKHPITHMMRPLIEQGADVNHVLHNTREGFYVVREEAPWLIERGADAQLLFSRINTQYPDMGLLESFIAGGVPKSDILDGLAEQFVANHHAELADRGFDRAALWSRAMKKPSASFVISNIWQLSEVGYSADVLSAHLTAQQVVDNIAALLEIGLSPSLAITQMMLVYRRSQAECEAILAQKIGVAI